MSMATNLGGWEGELAGTRVSFLTSKLNSLSSNSPSQGVWRTWGRRKWRGGGRATGERRGRGASVATSHREGVGELAGTRIPFLALQLY